MTDKKAEIIQLPKYADVTGTLFVADQDVLPFQPKRVFWMNGIRGKRGGHALKTCEQVIVALRGQFDVRAYRKRNAPMRWTLRFPHHGLYLPPMTWRDLMNFTIDTIVLVLCSDEYDPNDYIHEFADFTRQVGR